MTKKFLIGVVAAAAMMGCIKRTEVVNPTLETGTATIKGRVLVNSNYTNDTLQNHLGYSNFDDFMFYSIAWENQAGIEVSASIDLQDLNAKDNNSRGMEVVRTTTDANGNYTLTVRTPKNGEIDVDIDFQELLTTTVIANKDSINPMGDGDKGQLSAEWTIEIDNNSDWINIGNGQTVTLEDRVFMLN